jgi:hypothetical protein
VDAILRQTVTEMTQGRNSGSQPRMKRTRSEPSMARKLAAHRTLERKASLVMKQAETAHQQYRQAKVEYKAAKKAARSAKALWHRLRASARDAGRALDKSAKRLGRTKESPPAGA